MSEALAGGDLIAAIRRRRELTGLGLGEAEDAVEKLRRGHWREAVAESALQGVDR